MNSLERTLEENEIVVIKKEVFKEEYEDLKWRVVYVSGGFGMRHTTMGTALACTHVEDGEECRYEGYQIDVDETNKYQEIYGRFYNGDLK